MFSAAFGRNAGYGAFQDLQQRLLHAFTRHIAGDRGIVRFSRDLIDLVDIDDAALCVFDIVIRRLQQLQDDVFDILADITGFRQRGRIGDGERHIENSRQCLRQQRLSGTCRSDQENVRLRQFDVVVLALMIEPLVVVMDGDREHFFGLILADDIVIQHFADLARGRNTVA